jgi:hypothetical protein
MLEDIYHLIVMKHADRVEIVVNNLYFDLSIFLIFNSLETIGLYGSSILSPSENSYLASITRQPRKSLLYKATRDGFFASSFHSKCDGKANTVTTVKTNSNYVFGGFTAASWSSASNYSTDSTAFIFEMSYMWPSIW